MIGELRNTTIHPSRGSRPPVPLSLAGRCLSNLRDGGGTSVPAMDIVELLGLNDLLAQIVLAIGAAMVLGNGAAVWMHYTGRRPKKAEGEFRPARAWWLLGVGVVITVWGIASLVAG